MMTVISRVFASFSVLVMTLTTASPIENAKSSTLRYIPGEFHLSQGMKFDDFSVFNVGPDGVLRTFANNLTVLDYRQLDPDQVKSYALNYIAQLEAVGGEVPDSLTQLANSPVDGRTITDLDDLLNPKEKPNVPSVEAGNTPRAAKEGELKGIFQRAELCPSNPACESLNDCKAYPNGSGGVCMACYFSNGPPAGTCFID